jgi:biofilm PGA synthesis N-glycosyltransferase PgaC
LIVVNDDSTDETLNQLIKDYALHPIIPAFQNGVKTATIKTIYESNQYSNLRVIDKDHYEHISSGADAINAGLNTCKTPLFMTIDSDTIIEANTISAMIFSYLTHPHCIAVGGNIYIPDGPCLTDLQIKYTIPKNINLGVQVIEYLRSFFYGHQGWSKIGGAMCHSGACTLFEKRAVLEAGGFDRDNYSYDSEIIMNLHHTMRKNAYPYSIAYASSAIAWASQPSSLRGFWNQRNRWQRGLWRSFFKHINMMFNPKYGITGMIAFPFYFFFEILGPVVEGCAYLLFIYVILTRTIALNQVAWFILMAWSFLYLITLSCVLLNYVTYQKYYRIKDLFHIMGLSLAEIVFFRPFRGINAVYATLQFAWNRLWGKCL